MYINKMNCPQCNVALEIEEGIEEFSCPNCGCNIIIDFTPDNRNTRATNISDHYGQYTTNKQKSPLKKFLNGFTSFIIIIFIVLFGVELVINYQLNIVEENFYHYKDIGNYERAQSELDELIYPGIFSFSKKKWEKKKNTLETHLKDAMSNNKKILMPLSKQEAINMEYEKLKSTLEKAGFTNITAEEITQKPKWPKKAHNGQVIKIIVDKEEDFKKLSEYSSSTPIIIEYYNLS